MQAYLEKLDIYRKVRSSEKFLRFLSFRELLQWAYNNQISNYDIFAEALDGVGISMAERQQHIFDSA